MTQRLPKTVTVALASSALLLGLVACQKSETQPDASASPAAKSNMSDSVALESNIQLVSYGIGRNMGSQLAQDPSLNPDVDALIAGIKDSLNDVEPRVAEDKIMAAFQAFRAEAQAAAQAQAAAAAAEGKTFLDKNGARPEVTTTESGLQYEARSRPRPIRSASTTTAP